MMKYIILLFLPLSAYGGDYPWKIQPMGDTLSERFPVPDGYSRIPEQEDSFGAWLRNLPLLEGNPDVMLYNGRRKSNQRVHLAVIDIDVGKRDLQQCADAVMRLRGEYLYEKGQDVSFNFTSGDPARWSDWKHGQRPRLKGNKVTWSQRADANDSYQSFRKYMDMVFSYAGTHSLQREMAKVDDPAQIQIGDVFIQGGFPGHAVLVVDVVENQEGERMCMLVQSYMPAQQIHVLKNPDKSFKTAWYPAKSKGVLQTPEWKFRYTDLRRFK